MPVTWFSGWGCCTLPGFLWELLFLDFFVGQLCLGQRVFGPLPLSKKSTIETTLREFPSMPKWVVLSRHVMKYIECIHTVLLQKMVYRQDMTWRQIHRPTNATQKLDRLVSASKLKFWYLHRSQFWVVHVPHLSGAGWSKLPWGVLPGALDMTDPDGPASAGSLSIGGTGAKVLVFSTPATGASFSSCSMLELMGTK